MLVLFSVIILCLMKFLLNLQTSSEMNSFLRTNSRPFLSVERSNSTLFQNKAEFCEHNNCVKASMKDSRILQHRFHVKITKVQAHSHFKQKSRKVSKARAEPSLTIIQRLETPKSFNIDFT